MNLGVSATRRHRQALGATHSYDHVLGVGTTVTVHGVTVTVLGRSGDSYDVAVSGSYVMPPPNYFTEDVGEPFRARRSRSVPRSIAVALGRRRRRRATLDPLHNSSHVPASRVDNTPRITLCSRQRWD